MKLTTSHTISHQVSCNTETTETIDSLVRDMIGERTITKFCKDAGLSIGYVSRLLNGKLESTPSVRTLAKIACSNDKKDKSNVFMKLLKICGHNLDKEQIKREMQIAEQMSEMIEEERKDVELRKYNSLNLRASAMGLLFSSLMMMGVTIQPQGYFRPYDGIEFRVNSCQFERIIAISGFCGNSGEIIMAERDILCQLFKSVSSQKDVPMYLVLTDHKEVFEFISDVVGNSVTIYIYVLLANDNRTSFVEQRFFAADEDMKAPFEFVNDTK